jgi:galactose mutarotase-like enzyme
MVTRYEVAGRTVLFLDEASLADESKNVRGGIPVLFPTPGKLRDDRWKWGGREGTLPQHGFARRMPWTLRAHTRNELQLILEWNDPTGASWPWPCSLGIDYSLRDGRLHLSVQVTNRATTAMPFGFGLHPYFRVAQADKAQLRIPTEATRAFDNVSQREIQLHDPIDLTAAEVDLHLVDHRRSNAAMVWSEADHRIELRGSPELTRWVVWTLAGKDFVCLEPWTCPGDALNRDRDLRVLQPGERWQGFVEIAVRQRV